MDITARPDLLPLLQPQQAPSLNLARAAGDKAQAREAAQQFEAFFLRTILEDMIPEPEEDAFGGGGHAEKIWNSQLHEQYAEILAKRGGIGIADLVYSQLLRLQEIQEQATQEQATQKQAEPQQQPSADKEKTR